MSEDRSGPGDEQVEQGHRRLVAQPHDPQVESEVARAEQVAARMSTSDAPRGRPGRPFDRRSPFFVGMLATAGVAVTYGAIQLFLLAGNVLVLVGLALFLAVGLDPAVSFLVRRRLPRWAGVTLVVLTILAVVGGFLGVSIPALVSQVEQLVHNLPTYAQQLNNHSSFLGRLNERYGIVAKAQAFLSNSGATLFTGLLGAGEVLFSAFTDTLIVLVLTVYFLADLPRLRAVGYRLVPGSRRPRAILLGDEILAKVGGYVLGNLLVSLISGLLAFGWLIVFHVPYPVLLALLVAILDLIPVVGSTAAGAVVALVALSVSVPVCLATIAFFVCYRLAEDYLLIPRVIGRAVEVPGLITVLATLLGGALLGVLGALVAIPIAAGLLLVLREVALPWLDRA